MQNPQAEVAVRAVEVIMEEEIVEMTVVDVIVIVTVTVIVVDPVVVDLLAPPDSALRTTQSSKYALIMFLPGAAGKTLKITSVKLVKSPLPSVTETEWVKVLWSLPLLVI